MRKQWQYLGGIVVISVGMAGAGLWAGSRVKSADQAAAEARPPEPTVLTAVVEHRVLAATVIARATVGAEARVAVRPPRVPDGSVPIVTKVAVEPGQEVEPGALLFELAGRPAFVLPGAATAYRDLRPDDRGADVAALQGGLAAAGFDPQTRDGVFGASTREAVERFYGASGYEPLRAEPDGPGAVALAAAARDTARSAVLAARNAPDAQPATIKVAEDELVAAERRYGDLARRAGAMVAFGEVTFAASAPVRVAAVAVAPGAELGEDAPVTLATGRLRIEAKLPVADAAEIAAGSAGQADDELSGVSFAVRVAEIGRQESRPETGQLLQTIVCDPVDSVDPGLLDHNVRVRFTTAATAEPVFVVPLAAVSAGSDGRDRVVVQEAGGTRPVAIRAGLTADGSVEITPLGGILAEGDRVVVGR